MSGIIDVIDDVEARAHNSVRDASFILVNPKVVQNRRFRVKLIKRKGTICVEKMGMGLASRFYKQCKLSFSKLQLRLKGEGFFYHAQSIPVRGKFINCSITTTENNLQKSMEQSRNNYAIRRFRQANIINR